MKNLTTKKLVAAALFAALACVATMSIRIPTPGTGGYIHPGDAVVILCGIFLDPKTAFLAAGIGSSMADLLGGYFVYVPITLMIKGLTAWGGSHICRSMTQKGINVHKAVAVCGLFDMAMVAGGYFICELPLYGLAASFASVPSNLIQGASGLIISGILYPLLSKPLAGVIKS